MDPGQLLDNGRLVTSAREVAKIMNEFFISKVKLIRDSITDLPNIFKQCSEIMKEKRCRLHLSHVTVKKGILVLGKLQ